MASRVWIRALASFALVALVASPALAESEARYGGVTPGQAKAAPPQARGAWTELTWLGFIPEVEGRSRVFAQLSRDVQVEQAIVDGQLWVVLEHARPRARNATRPLDVRFFETELLTIRARRVGRAPARGDRPALSAGTKLVIEFRDPERVREASSSIVREDDGFTYLYLDF